VARVCEVIQQEAKEEVKKLSLRIETLENQHGENDLSTITDDDVHNCNNEKVLYALLIKFALRAREIVRNRNVEQESSSSMPVKSKIEE